MSRLHTDPVHLSSSELNKLTKLIKQNNVHPFYVSTKWMKERKYVLSIDKYECQHCKANSKLRRATIVHHIKHLREYPEYALSMWIEDEGKKVRQLISLCSDCHDKEHPERLRQYKNKYEFVTKERWD